MVTTFFTARTRRRPDPLILTAIPRNPVVTRQQVTSTTLLLLPEECEVSANVLEQLIQVDIRVFVDRFGVDGPRSRAFARRSLLTTCIQLIQCGLQSIKEKGELLVHPLRVAELESELEFGGRPAGVDLALISSAPHEPDGTDGQDDAKRPREDCDLRSPPSESRRHEAPPRRVDSFAGKMPNDIPREIEDTSVPLAPSSGESLHRDGREGAIDLSEQRPRRHTPILRQLDELIAFGREASEALCRWNGLELVKHFSECGQQVQVSLKPLVQLKYFAGLQVKEIARILDVSERTVKSDWSFARKWLHRELSRGDDDPGRGGSGLDDP